eukprot:31772-Hanusia_phi.AAC.1
MTSLKPLDQERVNKMNEAMIGIANETVSMIQEKGLKYHDEGVLFGNCLTIWNNTVDLGMNFLQRALDNKINKHFGCPADAFGMVMSCLKICGVGIDEEVNSDVADKFIRSFSCFISSAITYASDLKKSLNEVFEASEDISTPFSDNVFKDKGYIAYILKRIMISKHLKAEQSGFNGLKRVYHDSIFYDDCEGDASILKICFGMVHKFCMSINRSYNNPNTMLGMAHNIKSFSIMDDWSLEEIQKGLLQCNQLSSFIKDSSVELLLMSAKAPNVQKSTISDDSSDQEPDYNICGHCAAMMKHDGSLYLSEMTSPVFMLPQQGLSTASISDNDLNRMKRSYNKALEMSKRLRARKAAMAAARGRGDATGEEAVSTDATGPGAGEVTEELFYSQLCSDHAPDIVRSKVWLHMKKLDDVFWHIGGVLGDSMLMGPDQKTIGVPVSDLIKSNALKAIKSIQVTQSKEESDEFDFISTYATPPILPYIKVFESKVSRPLEKSIYPMSCPTVPLVYACHSPDEVEKLEIWADKECRTTCKIGKMTLGIQLEPIVDLQVIANHNLPVSTKFSLK